MEVKEIIDRSHWEKFVQGTDWSPFFQSWAFGEAEARVGSKVWRFGVYERGLPVIAAQVFLVKARRGTFLHLRHGPVFKRFREDAFKMLLAELKKLAHKNRAWFIRISPLLPDDSPLSVFFAELGFINSPVHNQDAENCLVLNLNKTLDEFLKAFRKNTRNLIRRAEKEGVVVKKSTDRKDLQIFFELYKQTAERDNFTPHQGILEEFEELKKDQSILLFIAYFDKKPLASSLIIFYGNQAVYHHSGSVRTTVPVNYKLQWEAIKEAKERGMRYYNFWGVAPDNKPRHPWQGLTLFKEGFGGERVNFLHAQDLPLSTLYWPSYLYQKIWNFRRGY